MHYDIKILRRAPIRIGDDVYVSIHMLNNDLINLGIDAAIRTFNQDFYIISFYNQEDMNLFKSSGKIISRDTYYRYVE